MASESVQKPPPSNPDDRWKELEKKYFIHEESKATLRRNIRLGNIPVYCQSLESLQAQAERDDDLTLEEKIQLTNFKGTMEEITIPADHLPDGIPTTIYKPEVIPSHPVIMIHFRGGGLVIGQRKNFQAMAMSIVNYTNVILVFPEYRNLPCAEDRLAPITDCVAASRWVLENKTAVGGQPESPVGLGGDSAGGLLCCSVNYTLPRQFAFQILYYPMTDLEVKGYESFEEMWTIPAFCGRDMIKVLEWCQLLEEPSQMDNPLVNPSAPRVTPPLSDSPPTLMLIAQIDPLRDWATAYSAKLRDAGVFVEEHMFEGALHGFVFHIQVSKTLAEKALKIINEFVTRFKPSESKL